MRPAAPPARRPDRGVCLGRRRSQLRNPRRGAGLWRARGRQRGRHDVLDHGSARQRHAGACLRTGRGHAADQHRPRRGRRRRPGPPVPAAPVVAARRPGPRHLARLASTRRGAGQGDRTPPSGGRPAVCIGADRHRRPAAGLPRRHPGRQPDLRRNRRAAAPRGPQFGGQAHGGQHRPQTGAAGRRLDAIALHLRAPAPASAAGRHRRPGPRLWPAARADTSARLVPQPRHAPTGGMDAGIV